MRNAEVGMRKSEVEGAATVNEDRKKIADYRLKNVGAAFSRDKPSLAPLIAAKSRSHNQKTIISGS